MEVVWIGFKDFRDIYQAKSGLSAQVHQRATKTSTALGYRSHQDKAMREIVRGDESIDHFLLLCNVVEDDEGEEEEHEEECDD
jgi:hypothetical protein